MQNLGNPQGRRSMRTHFNIIKKRANKKYNQGYVDDEKQADGAKKPYKNQQGKITIRNQNLCGSIGALKLPINNDILK